MSSEDHRLQKVGSALTPKQAVVAWLIEAQTYPTLSDWVASLAGQPESVYPLRAIPRQLQVAIRIAYRGRSDRTVAEAIQFQLRDAGFLVDLVVEANAHVIREAALPWALLALLNEQLRPILQGWETWDRPRTEQWAGQLSSLALQLLSRVLAVELIAERYLNGKNPLFPATADELTEQRAAVEQVISLFNDALPLGLFGPQDSGAGESCLGIDLEQLMIQARQHAVLLAEHLVLQARAEALAYIGDRRQAMAVLTTCLAEYMGV